ncbi:MAG: PAS domain S-box protein [Planctomycetales bacterium]|nr:PAS domain S-box protein [Planctomycetales bacterium]
MSNLGLLRRKLEREKNARREAERLLEEKSLEVYHANQQLLELAEQNRTIIESAAEGIITYDQEGAVRSANRSALRIFGLSLINGVYLNELFELTTAASYGLLFPEESNSTVRGGSVAEFDGHLPVEIKGLRNGETFQTEVAVGRSAFGQVTLFTAVVRDLTRRKKMEARLRQSQTMESVGQLAAGIAHEINTPIQFVGNNIHFLRGAFDDIGKLLDLYDQLTSAVREGHDPAELVDEIDRQVEVADLSFLRDEFPAAIEQSLEGIDRVAVIVRAMKEFSQSPSEVESAFDVNRAIENAVAMSASVFREVAAIQTSLDESIPTVLCMGSSLNQAFLNVLTNAIEAVSNHGEPGEGRIVISTKLNNVNQAIDVCFQDNGPGIPDEIQHRIFDPFFTTKDVGQGMGQGLSLVYDVVVNKHGGAVSVTSPPLCGTTIVLSIPLKPAELPVRREHADAVGRF